MEKLATIALAGYVGWMLVSGRSVWWSDRSHPNAFWFNSRWVFRGEEPGMYWFCIAWHVVILAVLGSIAFAG